MRAVLAALVAVAALALVPATVSADPGGGKSQSEPDCDGRGPDRGCVVSPDKPDGNNGQGNDPDCDDDSEGKGVPGHCRQTPATQPPGTTVPPTTAPPTTVPDDPPEDTIPPDTTTVPAQPTTTTAPAGVPVTPSTTSEPPQATTTAPAGRLAIETTTAAARRTTRTVARDGELAHTGFGLALLALGAVAMITVGLLARRWARRNPAAMILLLLVAAHAVRWRTFGVEWV